MFYWLNHNLMNKSLKAIFFENLGLGVGNKREVFVYSIKMCVCCVVDFGSV